MTITVDLGVVRVAYDLLEDAGAEEIQAAVDLMLAMIRSTRFRVPTAAALQFTKDNPFDVGGVPADAAAAVPSPSAAAGEFPARSPLFTTYEFTSIRISDRGEPRALSVTGKYARFGLSLATILDEYLKRAELSADVVVNLPSGTLLPHKPVKLRVDPNGVVTFVD
jgi:hypothetical protein